MLRDTTDMLVCAEDLGDVPAVVPKVLADLEILGLRILRWSREYGKTAPGKPAPFIPPASYPRLSVCTPSVHDTSTLRGWWEEDQEERETYYRFLGEPGACPPKMTRGLQERIVSQCLAAGSLVCMFQIQDIMDLDAELWSPDPRMDRINVPGTVNDQNWTWRMPLALEDARAARWSCGEPCGPLSRRRREKRKHMIESCPTFHFHVSRQARQRYDFPRELYSSTGNVITLDLHSARLLTRRINEVRAKAGMDPSQALRAGDMNAMGLIDEVLHYVTGLYRKSVDKSAFEKALSFLESRHGRGRGGRGPGRFVADVPAAGGA